MGTGGVYCHAVVRQVPGSAAASVGSVWVQVDVGPFMPGGRDGAAAFW